MTPGRKPVQTPLGPAYPPPIVIKLIHDLENVQKRMTELQMRINGLAYTPKKIRETRRAELESIMAKLNAELLLIQEQMQKHPLQPQHFKHPERWITECCKAYVNPPANTNDIVACPECTSPTTIYRRIDREKEEGEQRPDDTDTGHPFLAYA